MGAALSMWEAFGDKTLFPKTLRQYPWRWLKINGGFEENTNGILTYEHKTCGGPEV